MIFILPINFFCSFSGFNPNLKDIAKIYDEDSSRLLEDRFDLSPENRTIFGNLLKGIYTNTTFEENLGAVIRVNMFFNSIFA